MARQNQHADEEIAPGTVIDGRYRVVRAIGQGGNGMVYEVEHTRTGRRLALKALLDQTGFARLEQEARAASVMKNGHTARIIDMEPTGAAGPYMVMELLEGQSLRALLDEAGQLPLELTVNIAMQACECLQEAHALGIIHRDLKPENVYLCASPWPGQYDVKVLDFGVMKMAADGGAIPKSSLTRTGSTVGTPYYMSLEQLRNSSAVDARADVYSLGVVLYECLSGRKPFQAETIGDLVYALCSGPPTPLSRLRPDLPPDVGEVVMRTLSANRDDRPGSMVELATALLPYASPAFALWVTIDGRKPALGRPPAEPPSSIQIPATMGAPRASVAGVAGFASRNGVPRPSPSAASVPVPEVELAWPPDADAGARRDTPTEMYVKGVHGGPPEDEGTHSGDRDTPTRAYEAPPLRAPMHETLKSPVGLGGGQGEDIGHPAAGPRAGGDPSVDVKTMDLEARGPRFGAPPGEQIAAPPGALMTMPIPKATVPLGNVLRGLSPGMTPLSQQAAPPALAPLPIPLPPPKPAWQVSLDRALISVGRAGEGAARRFRAAPQNTQIIVVIIAGTSLILVIGLLAFLITH